MTKKIDVTQDFPSSSKSVLIFTLLFVLVLSLFFANVEIQIEGSAGWAASLPTWRIEHHWLLDLFWGGRAMTGYHAWVFSFMAIFFHFPFAFLGRWTWRAECRALACTMIFWITEDFAWFLLNPAFGWAKFNPAHVPWHKHWLGAFPQDYWVFLSVACLLIYFSFPKRQH